MSAVEIFDTAARWQPSIAQRYGFMPDAEAEVAAACWELIRAGEQDQGRLYWRTRRKVAALAQRHGRDSRTHPTDPALLEEHASAGCAVDAMLDRVAAEQIVARVPTPPSDVIRLTVGCPTLSSAGRARGRRWLRRYRRVLEAATP